MDTCLLSAEGMNTTDNGLDIACASQNVSEGAFENMVGHRGLEPRTSVLSGLRSNRLS